MVLEFVLVSCHQVTEPFGRMGSAEVSIVGTDIYCSDEVATYSWLRTGPYEEGLLGVLERPVLRVDSTSQDLFTGIASYGNQVEVAACFRAKVLDRSRPLFLTNIEDHLLQVLLVDSLGRHLE